MKNTQHTPAKNECRKCKSANANERYSFGYYAGRYCDKCWPKSGYRDATIAKATGQEVAVG